MQLLIQVVVSAIILGGFYALMAQGLSVIFGVTRVINLAHGEFLILGAYLGWAAHEYFGIDVLLALPVLILIGFIIGWIVSRVFVVPVLDRHELMPLLITFGIAFLIQGALTLVFGVDPRITDAVYSESVIEVFGIRASAAKVVMLLAALILLGFLSVFLRRTKLGKAMSAAAQNRAAARIVGINVTRAYSAAFGVGVAIAIAAGALFSVTQGFYPFMGPLFTLKAFVIVALGGTRMRGAMYAAMLLALVEVTLSSYVPNIGTTLGTAAALVMAVVVLAIRPEGISRAVGTKA